MRYLLVSAIVIFFSFFSLLKAQSASLIGSPESQARQNEEARVEGLERILNDARLKRMKKDGALVALPTNKNLEIDWRVPPRFRFCLPWTKMFLVDLSSNPAKTGIVKINSAVRTDVYQRQLRKHNKNAVPLSSHVFGCTVDIAKKGHTKAQLKVIRKYLLALEEAKLVEVTEENRQSVFHIMVFKKYIEKRSIPDK